MPEPTLTVWATDWLRESAPRWKPNTARNYAAALRAYWLPAFGARLLAELTRRDLRAHLLALRDDRGLAPRTVNQALAAIRACLSGAVDAEVLAANPALGLGWALGRRHGVRRAVVPRSEQIRALLAALERDAPAYHGVVAVMARAGLRIGEACGLQWDDLDFDARLIHVRRTVGDHGENAPKNGKPRAVDMSATLAGLLASQPRRGRWVFRRRHRDTPLDQRLVNQAIRRAAAAAGIDGHLTAHGLRHAYTSQLIECDVNLEWLRVQLGHADLRLISTVYGQHARLRNLAAVDRLG